MNLPVRAAMTVRQCRLRRIYARFAETIRDPRSVWVRVQMEVIMNASVPGITVGRVRRRHLELLLFGHSLSSLRLFIDLLLSNSRGFSLLAIDVRVRLFGRLVCSHRSG
jgi:hypothetical protein